MAAQFCPQCGTPARPIDRFCQGCGAQLAGAASSAPRDPFDPFAPYAPAPADAGDAAGGLDAGELVGFGWRTTMQNLARVLGLFITAMVIASIPQIVGSLAGDPAIAVIMSLASFFVVSPLMSMGIIKVALKLCRGEKPAFEDLFSSVQLIPSYLGATILFMLMLGVVFAVGFILSLIISAIGFAVLFTGDVSTGVGLMLVAFLIALFIVLVPTTIAWLIFGFYPYFIVDKRMGPVEALQASMRATKGSRMALLGLAVVSFLIVIAGLLCFIVGVIVATPVVFLAWALAYRRLAAHAEPSPMGAYGAYGI